MNRFSGNRRIVLTVIGGALIVLIGLGGQLGLVRWVFDHTLVPAGSGLTALGSSTAEAVSNLSKVKDLAKQNAQLQNQNASLRQRLAADDETRRDNDLLRKELGLQVAGAPKEIAAEVVAFQPDSYRQFVTINKGSKAGIHAGMAVLSEGTLIGTIADTTSSTARIMLVTDPDFKLAAQDQNTGATGIVNGQLGSGLEMTEIAQTDSIKPGDTVTTSGLGGNVPAGLYIGQVESVNARANVVFQQAAVTTNLDLKQLRFAFVVTGP